ncbi:MAG: hypothetical protein M0Q92_03625 [Methanoregula sp.]|nr:hypothetical protein [Methanoregula sp.]
MTDNNTRTRAAVCGTGVLLALIFFFAELPLMLLIVPVVIVIFGIVAAQEGMHAAWYGMLNTLGIFDPAVLTREEKENYAKNRHSFWFGETATAAALAAVFAVPAGMILAGKTGSMLSFIIAAMIFLLLFVFLPKIIQRGMKTDTETILDLFGKNEQVKKVFWSVFIALAGIVFAEIVDPAAMQQILGTMAGM